MKRYSFVLLFTVALALVSTTEAHAQDYNEIFAEANSLFRQGEYSAAVAIYDDILEAHPSNVDVLRQKAIALSNNERHRESLITFHTILQSNPSDAVSLAGTGVGFGNLGEYQESKEYFARAIAQEPENIVYQNYAEFVDGVIAKYPYTPTQKPPRPATSTIEKVPSWTLNVAHWWSQDIVRDTEFFEMINYLVSQNVIVTKHVHNPIMSTEQAEQMIVSLKQRISEQTLESIDMAGLVQELGDAGFVTLSINDDAHSPEHARNDRFWFRNYLNKISSNVEKEKRYIEYPNPSGQVIKKFLRDYVKWNFEQEANRASTEFKDPQTTTSGDVITIHYNVFVNQQPTGLPLDHVSTLKFALEYWEVQTLKSGDKDVKIEFNITNKKRDANVWVTWVVRDLGESVLGHANVGKGIVEVSLGGYDCDGSFQLYGVQTVLDVMTHELGHSVGLGHSENAESIMYPTLTPTYAYCLI